MQTEYSSNFVKALISTAATPRSGSLNAETSSAVKKSSAVKTSIINSVNSWFRAVQITMQRIRSLNRMMAAKGKRLRRRLCDGGGGKNQPWVYRRMRREPVFFTVVLVTCPGTVVVGVGSRRSRFQSVDRAAQRTATDSAINQPNDRANWRFFLVFFAPLPFARRG